MIIYERTGLFEYVYDFSGDYLGFIGLSSYNAINYVSISNQECMIRATVVDVNNNNPLFYPCSVVVNKCNGNGNTINNPYAKLCVHDVVKDIILKYSI